MADLFERPPVDWADAELAVGLAELGRRIAELRETGDVDLVNQLTAVALALREEVERRAEVVARARQAAMRAVFVDDEPARWLQPPGLRRALRRRPPHPG
jgi:hypothetical protein